MTVEIGLTPDGRWDTGFDGLVDAAGAAGFSALGVAAGQVDAGTASALAAGGLRCHELLALMVSDDAGATLASAEVLAAAAGQVGAQWVLTVFRAGLTSETAEIIERCAAMFAEAGAGMAVEFSPLGPVATLPVALEVVDAAGAGRAGVVIDTWHFGFGDSTFDDLAAVPLEQIAYVQFTDALEPISDRPGRETMNRRALPGDGILDLERFAATLLGRGWNGLVSVEVLSDELRERPVSEVARLLHDSTARYWA